MSLISGRVILAAAKLASFYAALVLLEILLLAAAFRLGVPTIREMGEMASMLAIPFAGAFLLLAIARRWGFVALWVILSAFWILIAMASGSWRWSIDFPRVFVPWSMFALPLWIIGQAGIRRSSAHRVSPSMAMLAGWAILLLCVQFFGLPRTDFVHPHRFGIVELLAWAYAPVPIILSAFALRHVWRGTAKPVAA